jgi:hypothetical protein
MFFWSVSLDFCAFSNLGDVFCDQYRWNNHLSFVGLSSRWYQRLKNELSHLQSEFRLSRVLFHCCRSITWSRMSSGRNENNQSQTLSTPVSSSSSTTAATFSATSQLRQEKYCSTGETRDTLCCRDDLLLGIGGWVSDQRHWPQKLHK